MPAAVCNAACYCDHAVLYIELLSKFEGLKACQLMFESVPLTASHGGLERQFLQHKAQGWARQLQQLECLLWVI
jgi:hypothetical protein